MEDYLFDTENSLIACDTHPASRKIRFSLEGNHNKIHNQSKYKVVEPEPKDAFTIQYPHLNIRDQGRSRVEIL